MGRMLLVALLLCAWTQVAPAADIVVGSVVAARGDVYTDSGGGAPLQPLMVNAPVHRGATIVTTLGIPAYGFIPCLLSPEERRGFHGNNEYLTIENLNMGCELMYEIVRRMVV